MMKITNLIKDQITLFKGQQELKGNSGFKEAWFQRAMCRVGWKKYQSWCAYAAESIWVRAYEKIGDKDVLKELDRLFNASAVQTYKNFIKAGYPHGMIPRVGALAVWQLKVNGKKSWKGHIGVVETISSNNIFISGEGNTNKGKSRNGWLFWTNKHEIDKEINVENGLEFLGFIYPYRYAFRNGMKKTDAYEY